MQMSTYLGNYRPLRESHVSLFCIEQFKGDELEWPLGVTSVSEDHIRLIGTENTASPTQLT